MQRLERADLYLARRPSEGEFAVLSVTTVGDYDHRERFTFSMDCIDAERLIGSLQDAVREMTGETDD